MCRPPSVTGPGAAHRAEVAGILQRAQHLLDVEGHAAGILGQALAQSEVRPLAGERLDQRAGGVGCEPLEADLADVRQADPVLAELRPAGDDHQNRRRAEGRHEMTEDVRALGVGPVRVLDDQDRLRLLRPGGEKEAHRLDQQVAAALARLLRPIACVVRQSKQDGDGGHQLHAVAAEFFLRARQDLARRRFGRQFQPCADEAPESDEAASAAKLREIRTEDTCPVAAAEEFVDKARLAQSRLADHHDDPAARAGALGVPLQFGQFFRTPDEAAETTGAAGGPPGAGADSTDAPGRKAHVRARQIDEIALGEVEGAATLRLGRGSEADLAGCGGEGELAGDLCDQPLPPILPGQTVAGVNAAGRREVPQVEGQQCCRECRAFLRGRRAERERELRPGSPEARAPGACRRRRDPLQRRPDSGLGRFRVRIGERRLKRRDNEVQDRHVAHVPSAGRGFRRPVRRRCRAHRRWIAGRHGPLRLSSERRPLAQVPPERRRLLLGCDGKLRPQPFGRLAICVERGVAPSLVRERRHQVAQRRLVERVEREAAAGGRLDIGKAPLRQPRGRQSRERLGEQAPQARPFRREAGLELVARRFEALQRCARHPLQDPFQRVGILFRCGQGGRVDVRAVGAQAHPAWRDLERKRLRVRQRGPQPVERLAQRCSRLLLLARGPEQGRQTPRDLSADPAPAPRVREEAPSAASASRPGRRRGAPRNDRRAVSRAVPWSAVLQRDAGQPGAAPGIGWYSLARSETPRAGEYRQRCRPSRQAGMREAQGRISRRFHVIRPRRLTAWAECLLIRNEPDEDHDEDHAKQTLDADAVLPLGSTGAAMTAIAR